MTTTQQAAGTITRGADPQGDHFGVSADVSYSFSGGAWAFTGAQETATVNAMHLWSDVAQINFFVDNEDPEIFYENYWNPQNPDNTGGTSNAAPGHFNPDERHDVGLNLAYSSNLLAQLGQGQVGLKALIHEIGHAIGLD